jgi:hypothetical protein
MNFEIRTISIQEISGYISSDVWERAKVIPITPERARSQQANPNARPGDPCLWVATAEQGEVIGFVGSLPAIDIRTSERMGWNTCWWVDPDLGKEAAMPLYYHFLRYWDQRVAFADMTPRTRAIIDQLGFCHTRSEVLVHSHIRLSASKLSARAGLPGKLLHPLILLDAFIVNALLQVRLNLSVRRTEGAEFEARAHMDDELHGFIMQHQDKDFTQRSREEYEWIETHPWLVAETPDTREIGKKYPFSHVANRYKLEWLISRRGNAITSVMLISYRDGALKVLYYFGDQPRDAFLALKERISKDRSVASLIFAHPAMVRQVREIKSIRLYTRRIDRLVGVSKKILEQLPDDLIIQMGDGDSVFT